ncbi:ATP-binding cassette domain-containing protein [Fructobacillus durionis]|uniref:UvrABC system protein A n=1 Tax=Fructobacillus durionis TaxID=283737 RepID=A0A1I1EIW2_9LACO|nr:excinuclease ABC subunit UvrA [Fructobacillus durionis]SFB87044.1 excinuclease ABC subunit A [Fructobacillus durionis]
MIEKSHIPSQIEVRGGRVHNLKNIDVNIPLNKFVAISGRSGSGKSSLAMGILFSEGSRRYLEALSAYTRNRMGQESSADVDSIQYIPSAIALKQRPATPGERSTVGSISELSNITRLIFSRLGSPVCPNGHRLEPSLAISRAMNEAEKPGEHHNEGQLPCPVCGVHFTAFSAQDFSANSTGACPTCHGSGQVRELDEAKLIKDVNLSIKEGAVASWHLPGRNFMPSIAQSLGVRIDVPYKDLTDKEKSIVLHGEKKLYPVDFHTSTGRVYHSDGSLYENAYDAVTDSLANVKSQATLKKLDKFYHFSTCPTCHGSRLNPDLLKQTVDGKNIVQVNDLTLGELTNWADNTVDSLPNNMEHLANTLFTNMKQVLRPILNLGLDYLTMSRAGASLSTGELQRLQLSKTIRAQTTGVLYVLDEPSIGLHPDNIKGLIQVFRELIAQGNSLVVVDHEVDLIAAADWIIEIGPGSGEAGGLIIDEGTPAKLTNDSQSLIGPFIKGSANIVHDSVTPVGTGKTTLRVQNYHNLKDVQVTIPEHQMTAVTGFSGAGKTSLILDNLIPAIQNKENNLKTVSELTTNITNTVTIDAKPIGRNTRSTLATYTNIMNELRRLFASLPEAKKAKLSASAFSYNNKEGACPTCQGLGVITEDVQFLPDIVETCPTCQGARFNDQAQSIKWQGQSIVDLLNLSVKEALPVFKGEAKIESELKLLDEIGLNYLHLGQATPSLSGGEAQRLKLVSHLHKSQMHTLFVFDEPTIGLHPLDVQTLLGVFNRLKEKGATIIFITHDLDMMTNADWLIDLGPRGGNQGGQLMAMGKPFDLAKEPHSLTTEYLAKHLSKFDLI